MRPSTIGGVMVSVLASSGIDHGFEPWSDQTLTIELVFDASFAKHRPFKEPEQRLVGSEKG
jgi:hypothetical protein